MDAWHVAVTLSGREGHALRNLTGATNTPGLPPPIVEPLAWDKKRYQTVWPRWVEYQHRAPRFGGFDREIVRPLASGYLLVRFGTDAEWHDVLDRCGPGTHFIGGGSPAPVPDAEVEKLLTNAFTADGVLPKREKTAAAFGVAPGDQIRMVIPPWTDHVARVIWVDQGGTKIELSLFGRPCALWFPHDAAAYELIEKHEVRTFRSTRTPQYGRRVAA